MRIVQSCARFAYDAGIWRTKTTQCTDKMIVFGVPTSAPEAQKNAFLGQTDSLLVPVSAAEKKYYVLTNGC
jgi:hypothetical protein